MTEKKGFYDEKKKFFENVKKKLQQGGWISFLKGNFLNILATEIKVLNHEKLLNLKKFNESLKISKSFNESFEILTRSKNFKNFGI